MIPHASQYTFDASKVEAAIAKGFKEAAYYDKIIVDNLLIKQEGAIKHILEGKGYVVLDIITGECKHNLTFHSNQACQRYIVQLAVNNVK